MEPGKVYSEAMKYAEKLIQRRPQSANSDAAIIINEKNEVYAGVAATVNRNGEMVQVPAETSAFLIMRNSGGVKATNIAVFNLGNREIIMPAAETLELMVMASAENDNCMILLGKNDEMPVFALREPVKEAAKEKQEKEAAKEAAAVDIPDEEYEPMEEIRFADLDEAPKEEAKPAEEKAEEVPAEEKAEEVPAEEKAEEAPAEEKAEEAPAEEKAEEAPAEEKAEEAPAEENAEEAPADDAEVDKALDAMDAFMEGFDFDMPEPEELTPEEEAAQLEEKKARQRAAAEAIEKKLAEKAAASKSADSISGVGIDESNPFFEASADVKPPEEVLAVMSEVQQEVDRSLNPEESDDSEEEPALTPEELLKQAKKRKKVAKSNFLFRKRM